MLATHYGGRERAATTATISAVSAAHEGVAVATKRISRLEDELEKTKKELAEEVKKRKVLERKFELIMEWVKAQGK